MFLIQVGRRLLIQNIWKRAIESLDVVLPLSPSQLQPVVAVVQSYHWYVTAADVGWSKIAK